MGSKRALVVGAVAALVAVGAGGAAIALLGSHQAPGEFALGSAGPSASAPLAGDWKVVPPSEAGYRAREKFINQQSSTEAVARTSKVSGSTRIRVAGANYVAGSIDLKVDLVSLVSQDQYAKFQAYERDFFVRSIYLQTSVYPTAEFKGDSVTVPLAQAPGPIDLSVAGKLSAHGVTRPVTAGMKVQLTGDELEVAGTIPVDMRDFGIEPPDISFTKAEPGVVVEYHVFMRRA